MALKDWKKNVNLAVKQSWENKKTGEEVFITPVHFNILNGEWDFHFERQSKGLDVLSRARRKNKKSALAFARKYMRSH